LHDVEAVKIDYYRIAVVIAENVADVGVSVDDPEVTTTC
jgi:hypothetical protein